ncbi:hypothetical protein M5K25_010183 [Dendrobium thyrsiflorum]|uniref:RRM domain-containing protein n=1 Tax=Dendrobium thyrsiflorum TaxID=117978 RepID=A0ABD0UZY8_DENTH
MDSVGAGNSKKQISLPESAEQPPYDTWQDVWHYVRFFSRFTGTHLLPCLLLPNHPNLVASLPNSRHEEIKASLMESEKGKAAAATNDSVDNEGAADDGEPWNRLMEKHLRALARTLHKKELVDHLVNLGMTFPQAADEIRSAARLHLADRRLIVYGLGEETTSETLCDAYSSYGEIAEGQVMVDSATGMSRRYGFITFKNIDSVEKALERRSKLIDGYQASHKPAREGFDGAMATADVELRRLYVADFSTDITTEMFLGFFAKYGEVEEGSLIFDEETRKSRGFGFVTFKTFEAAMNVVNDPDKTLGSNKIFVRHAYKYKYRAIVFSDEDVVKLASPFQFTLVGKFSIQHPNMMLSMGFFLSDNFSVGLLDPRHVAIQLSNDLDYSQIFSRRSYYISNC